MIVGLGIMARAPASPGKTRLAAHLSPPRLAALQRALASDTLATACSIPGIDPILFVTPAGAAEDVAALAARAVPAVAQRGDDLGARMCHAVEYLIDDLRCDAAILIGTDVPLLTAAHVADAVNALRSGSTLVVGPALDGGYYLIGMTRVIAAVFEGIEWGSGDVLAQTMAAAERAGIAVATIATLYDVDGIDDLRRVTADLCGAPPSTAPALREFLSE